MSGPTDLPTLPDAHLTGLLAGAVLGADRAEEMSDPIMGSEDFSFVRCPPCETFA